MLKNMKFLVVIPALVFATVACQTANGGTVPPQTSSNTQVADLGSTQHQCLSEVPLPGYQVTQPSANVPENIAKFSGVWAGYWRDGSKDALCHVLIVESIDENGAAKIIYSTGTYRPWGMSRGEYGRFDAKITSGGLSATLGNGTKVSYRHDTNGDLQGNYGYGRSFGVFKRDGGN